MHLEQKIEDILDKQRLSDPTAVVFPLETVQQEPYA